MCEACRWGAGLPRKIISPASDHTGGARKFHTGIGANGCIAYAGISDIRFYQTALAKQTDAVYFEKIALQAHQRYCCNKTAVCAPPRKEYRQEHYPGILPG
jgi:hypothetical protein